MHDLLLCVFFFHATHPTQIYTLSLHDALPISPLRQSRVCWAKLRSLASVWDTSSCRWRVGQRHLSSSLATAAPTNRCSTRDRKSTRLNSSHPSISYAVFCLKKKKKHKRQHSHK